MLLYIGEQSKFIGEQCKQLDERDRRIAEQAHAGTIPGLIGSTHSSSAGRSPVSLFVTRGRPAARDA